MASLREFEPYAIFTRIDRDRKEYISSRDIAAFLRYFFPEIIDLGATMGMHTAKPRSIIW
jgi:hypothetical protein